MTKPGRLGQAGGAAQAAALEGRAQLRAVERAIDDLRRGEPVLIRPRGGPAVLVLACETATDPALATLARLGRSAPAVVITGQRAVALGVAERTDAPVVLSPGGEAFDERSLRAITDPTEFADRDRLAACPVRPLQADRDPDTEGLAGAICLAKLAHLLPAASFVPIERPFGPDRLAAETDILSVAAPDIGSYERKAAGRLRQVADAVVPLTEAEQARILAFRPLDGSLEHLAIVIGAPDPSRPVLIRLHSECFTGDLLASLRCDCGEQLRGAIAAIAREGGGIVLYMAQEGRGIGLVNKLRAYRLQDEAIDTIDTIDANQLLGFEADERGYRPAAEMLRQMGVTRVRLITNNPDKVSELGNWGIDVVGRVPQIFPSNRHNRRYMETKKERGGHLL